MKFENNKLEIEFNEENKLVKLMEIISNHKSDNIFIKEYGYMRQIINKLIDKYNIKQKGIKFVLNPFSKKLYITFENLDKFTLLEMARDAYALFDSECLYFVNLFYIDKYTYVTKLGIILMFFDNLSTTLTKTELVNYIKELFKEVEL